MGAIWTNSCDDRRRGSGRLGVANDDISEIGANRPRQAREISALRRVDRWSPNRSQGLIDPIGADRAGRVVAECLAIGLGGPKQS